MTRFLYVAHRWIGLGAAALFVVLAVSGPLLTRAESLHLNERYISSDLLLALYRTEPANPPVGVATPAGWVLGADGVVTLEDRVIGLDQGPLLGAAVADDLLLVATGTGLSLHALNGDLIERLGTDSLPGPVLRIGTASDGAVLATSAGDYQSLDGYLTWVPADDAPVAWSQATANPPTRQLDLWSAAYRRQLVTVHRFLSDVHSGRIFGAWGPYLMDAAAIGMLLMVLSGFSNWLSTRR